MRLLRRSRRPALACLLAALVALHGLVASWSAARGPAHVHRTPVGANWVFDDLRRSVPTVAAHATHLPTGFLHWHSANTVGHHHHAIGDASVVPVADASRTLASDDGVTTALAAFVAILASPRALNAPSTRLNTVPRHAGWSAYTHVGPRPERPPRLT